MIIKHQGVLRDLAKLCKTALLANDLDMTSVDDSSLYICFEEDILLMSHDTDGFVKNDHKPSSLRTNLFYRRDRILLDRLQLCHLQKDKERSSTFARFLDTKVRRSRIISHSIIPYSPTP